MDHGTAFDIAGKGIASEDSLIEAVRQAAAERAIEATARKAAAKKYPDFGAGRERGIFVFAGRLLPQPVRTGRLT